jgi:hypothetical protein
MSEQEPQGDKQVCILREVDGEDGYRFFVWSFGSGAERSSTASNPPKPEEETPVQAQAKDPVSTALTPNGPFFGRAGARAWRVDDAEHTKYTFCAHKIRT